jgi:hypothetical protein
MADKFNYRLREDLSLTQVIEFVKKLHNNHRLVNKGYLEPGIIPKIPQVNFELFYDKEKYSKEGNISPHDFLDILKGISNRLYDGRKIKDSGIYIPTQEGTLAYNAFFLQGEFSNSSNLISERYQTMIVGVLHDVATGALLGKTAEEDEKIKPSLISQLSYSFRQGNLEDNWGKDKGVKAFTNLIIATEAGELLIDGSSFGPEYDKEFYAIEHALEALSEYHRAFKETVRHHKNYKHPKDSKEKKDLDRLEAKSYPFFSGRSVLEQTLITSDQLTGKLSTDDTNLKEFIEVFDAAIKALKKDVPLSPSGGSGDDDTDGGEPDEPEEKREKAKAIDFDGLYQIINGKLIGFIYQEYYFERVDEIDEDLQKVNRYEVRKVLLGRIKINIDSTVNLRAVIKDRLNTSWSNKVEGENIYNDDELTGLIEELVKELTSKFDFDARSTENLQIAIDILRGTLSPPEESGDLPEITAGVVPQVLVFIEENIPPGEKEEWGKLTTSQKVSYWKTLTLRQRIAFLEEHGFMIYVETYSEKITQEFLEEQLAQHHITRANRAHFEYLLKMMRAKIENDLFEIAPTEFVNDPEVFINKQRGDSDFLRMEQAWIIEFAPTLETEINDYIIHNPQAITIDLRGVTTLEEAAVIVNPNLENPDQRVDDILEGASNQILEIIYRDLGLPNDIILNDQDRRKSLAEIRIFLRSYLLEHPDSLPLLFTEIQLLRFINEHGYQFIERRGSRFTPIIEERFHEAHRQHVLVEIERKVGAVATNETLHYILAQSVLSQTNPEDYIKSLSDDDLLALFPDIDKKLLEDPSFFAELRELLLEYMEASRNSLYLDDKIDDPQEFDKEEFNEGITFLKKQSKRGGSLGGGRAMYNALTKEEAEADEIIDFEDNLDELAKKEYEKQILINLAIWEAYSKEEQEFLEDQNARDLAIYNQRKIIEQEEKKQAKKSGKKIDKKKKQSRKKKWLKKGMDKAIVAGGSAALSMVPGVGTAVAAMIKVLPIPDKYKKYLAIGIVGPVVALLMHTAYIMATSWGGLIGGLLGTYLTGGPWGAVIGSHIGWGLQNVLENALGTDLGGPFQAIKGIGDFFNGVGGTISDVGGWIGNGISGVGNWIGDGLSNIVGGGSPSVSSAPSLGLEISTTTTIAAQTVIASTVGVGLIGIIITSNIHSSFLQRFPESLNYSQDSSSKYVQIEKTANPSSMENGETSDITYSVTISPSEGYIIIVDQATDEISVLGSDAGNSSFSVDQDQITQQLQPNTEISSPITIEYTLPGVSGTDIALNNTFTLNFFVEDEGETVSESAQDSAVVTIGDPELGCFQFGDAGTTVRGVSSAQWTESDKNKIINAYQRVLNNTTFMGLMCSDGPITFYRISGSEYGGWALSANEIGIYDLGVTSQNSATYTTIHELGHLMDYRNPGLRNNFQAIWSGSCFTYPYTCYAGEPFAEAVALYEVYGFYNFRNDSGGRSVYDFPGKHPREYSWVETNIYGGGN